MYQSWMGPCFFSVEGPGNVNRLSEPLKYLGLFSLKIMRGVKYTFTLVWPKTWGSPGPPGPLGDAIPDKQSMIQGYFSRKYFSRLT